MLCSEETEDPLRIGESTAGGVKGGVSTERAFIRVGVAY